MSSYTEDNSYTIEFKDIRKKKAFAKWFYEKGDDLFREDYKQLTKAIFKVGDTVRYHASLPPSLVRNRIYSVINVYLSDDNKTIYEIKRDQDTFFVSEGELTLVSLHELEQLAKESV